MNELERKRLIEIADAAEDLCDLWTYALADMDHRLVAARERLRAADIAYRRVVGKLNRPFNPALTGRGE